MEVAGKRTHPPPLRDQGASACMQGMNKRWAPMPATHANIAVHVPVHLPAAHTEPYPLPPPPAGP